MIPLNLRGFAQFAYATKCQSTQVLALKLQSSCPINVPSAANVRNELELV